MPHGLKQLLTATSKHTPSTINQQSINQLAINHQPSISNQSSTSNPPYTLHNTTHTHKHKHVTLDTGLEATAEEDRGGETADEEEPNGVSLDWQKGVCVSDHV